MTKVCDDSLSLSYLLSAANVAVDWLLMPHA
jgi:hypothetical protein